MNQITVVQYRDKPLTVEAFGKLEALANRFMSIREKTVGKSMPVFDHNDEIIRWEYQLVPCGMEVFFKTEPDQAVMASIRRPATPEAIGIHLTRLCQHRPYGRGQEGWGMVVEDLMRDLAGCSEWALMKVCEGYRLQRGKDTTFFPATADLVAAVKALDDQIRWTGESRAKEYKPAAKFTEEPLPERTTKAKRRVKRLVSINSKPKAGWTKWERRFFTAITRK